MSFDRIKEINNKLEIIDNIEVENIDDHEAENILDRALTRAKQNEGEWVTAFIKAARAQLGKPYRGGASGPDGFDCSGLVMYCAKQANADTYFGRSTYDQMDILANNKIAYNKRKLGDVIYTKSKSHVVISLGGDEILHSPRTGEVVKVAKIYDGLTEVYRPSAYLAKKGVLTTGGQGSDSGASGDGNNGSSSGGTDTSGVDANVDTGYDENKKLSKEESNLLNDKKVLELYRKSLAVDKEEMYDVSTRLFNSPFHLLPTADPLINTKVNLGRKYMENIASNSAIVYVLPVTTRFMPGADNDRKDIFKTLLADSANNVLEDVALSEILDKGVETKFFDSKPAYTEYMKYVNLLCRSIAMFLGIGDDVGPDGKTKYQYYNWYNYKYRNFVEPEESKTMFEKAADSVASAADYLFSGFQYVQFYADTDTSASESYSNSVGDSSIAGVLQKGSDLAREFNFIVNGAKVDSVNGVYKSMVKQVGDLFDQFSGGGGVTERLGSAAVSILNGSNVILPQIWTGSEASPSTSFKLDLAAPYGNVQSVYLETLVPFAHVLAFSLPRQNNPNSHASPFLIRAFSKGWFSTELGIVSGLSVDKAEWNVNGLPSRITLSIQISDLYKDLSISSTESITAFSANIALVDYLKMTCGVDISKPHLMIQLDLLSTLLLRKPVDFLDTTYQGFVEGMRNVVNNTWSSLTKL